MEEGHFEITYSQIVNDEDNAKALLKQFESYYPGITNESNVDAIVTELQQNSRASVSAFLREQKAQIDRTDPKDKNPRNNDDLELR